MKKKIIVILVVLILIAGIAGVTLNQKGNAVYTVGICQFMQHESLDAATQGFKDALTEKFGEHVIFNEQNAQGDYSTCTTAVNGLVSADVDLILANSTAALQTAVTATAEIPILGTAVTDYGAALERNDFGGVVGGNVSGTSDLAPLDGQAAMIQELFPEAGMIGILYCSSEPNSRYQADVMQEKLEGFGYTCRAYTFSDSNDLSSVAASAASECDVIYVPTDNTAASCAQLIANVCMPAKVPVVSGDESTCRICGAATLSISYYDLGYLTGEMAARILVDGEDISEMPIEYTSHFTKKYNADVCQTLGIQVPEDYVALDAE